MSSTIQSIFQLVMEAFKEILGLLMKFKILITLAILAWGIFISKKVIDNASDSRPSVDYLKYYNLHRIWFGEESLIVILFKMWISYLLLTVITPTLLNTVQKSNLSSYLSKAVEATKR